MQGQLGRLPEIPGRFANQHQRNHDLKNIFKGAATEFAAVRGPFQEFPAYGLVARGMEANDGASHPGAGSAAITLIVWKKGVSFDAQHLKQQAA